MGEKTYLKDQIRLLSMTTSDFFTPEELQTYQKILTVKARLDDSDENDRETIAALVLQKKEYNKEFEQLIAAHKGRPRTVNLDLVCKKQDVMPPGVSFHNLKFNRIISEFCSELSRAMGLKPMDRTLDLIVITWKSPDVMEQLIKEGFTMKILNPDGTVEERRYHLYTASAGQLRKDKFLCISDQMWEKIHERIECGLSWEKINQHGGVNCNKALAYYALPCTSTDPWLDFDIDRCIVVPDFEGEVTGRMLYIKPDYTFQDAVQTVKIKHTDGVGMMLPCVSRINFMIRGPWFKGLLSTFDFIEFCRVNDVKPVITDIYGLEHDLVKENIQIIFTASQFKMNAYYSSWQEYKDAFRKCGAQFGRMKYEEENIDLSSVNYQFTDSLTDFTDEEIIQFTANEHERILNITQNEGTMLRTLGADVNSEIPYRAALALYPEMLWETYTHTQLKEIRKRMIQDAKSGTIRTLSKRLFTVPDLYAACESWFCHIENPEGLLPDGVIACKEFIKYDRADVLRSPHLYMEHAIRTITHNRNIYKWFTTKGTYVSCHDLISRILQMDWDGDEVNVVVDPLYVSIAERNIREFDVVPLFYDANSAPKEMLSRETQFEGLVRAHEFSNGKELSIGKISNMLTRLWNKDNPDRIAAAWLTMFNNLVIDAAKTGVISHYNNYPNVKRRINRAVGDKSLPFWYRFSKNGRRAIHAGKKRKYLQPNGSTMNRICKAFEDIGRINLQRADVQPFNWQMYLSEPVKKYDPSIGELFCDLDRVNTANVIEASAIDYSKNKLQKANYDLLAELIKEELVSRYKSLETVYPPIVQYLYFGPGMTKSSGKQMFWRIFGDIALNNLRENLKSYTICGNCGAKIPEWGQKTHVCPSKLKGLMACESCGKVFIRTSSTQKKCPNCQEVHAHEIDLKRRRERYYRRIQLEAELKNKNLEKLKIKKE